MMAGMPELRLCNRSKCEKAGRLLCLSMKELMDRQMMDVKIQAAAGSKIIASETIKAYRKNVLAKCYGGAFLSHILLCLLHLS